MSDPLLNLITEYRAALVEYRKAPDDDDTNEELAFGNAYDRLCNDPPNATTLEGAIAAVYLVRDEESTCSNQPDLTVKVLSAALAYFAGVTACAP